jgi:hypothetical protein
MRPIALVPSRATIESAPRKTLSLVETATIVVDDPLRPVMITTAKTINV